MFASVTCRSKRCEQYLWDPMCMRTQAWETVERLVPPHSECQPPSSLWTDCQRQKPGLGIPFLLGVWQTWCLPAGGCPQTSRDLSQPEALWRLSHGSLQHTKPHLCARPFRTSVYRMLPPCGHLTSEKPMENSVEGSGVLSPYRGFFQSQQRLLGHMDSTRSDSGSTWRDGIPG